MQLPSTRSLGLAAGAVALTAGALVVPGVADAQSAGPALTATPTQTAPGGTVVLTATGCESEVHPADELVVSFTTAGGTDVVGMDEPDATGEASFSLTFPEGSAPGTFAFEASCFHPEGTEGGGTTLFTYDPVDVTVVAPTSTTTAPTATTTAAPAAAPATATRPAFTG